MNYIYFQKFYIKKIDVFLQNFIFSMKVVLKHSQNSDKFFFPQNSLLTNSLRASINKTQELKSLSLSVSQSYSILRRQLNLVSYRDIKKMALFLKENITLNFSIFTFFFFFFEKRNQHYLPQKKEKQMYLIYNCVDQLSVSLIKENITLNFSIFTYYYFF